MNYNIITYLVYSGISGFIILRVGWVFYKNGAHYLHEIFPEDQAVAATINRLLLIGYYLLNLGYVAASLSFWPEVESMIQLIELTAESIAWMLLTLGIVHFLNMLWVRLLKQYYTST